MDALQSVDMRTPIEMVLDIDSEGMTTARKLYEFLELAPQHYARWLKSNILDNEFATENEDYFHSPSMGNEQGRGNFADDYKLTAHFAKKLSVKGNGEKSEQAREYFTRVEERVKKKAIDMSQLSPELQMFNKIFQSVATQQLEQKRQAEEIEKIKEQQAVITDTFAIKKDVEDFQRWANGCLAKIAESPNFTNGFSRNMRHQNARAESYERIAQKRNCRLDDRVARAKGRALEERPDIKKAELNKINKIYVISNDKDLRPAYELVIKEMMIYYCVKIA